MPEDVLAVAGHCCSVRLTRLPELEEGIDFTPDAAARADFDKLRALPGSGPSVTATAQETPD